MSGKKRDMNVHVTRRITRDVPPSVVTIAATSTSPRQRGRSSVSPDIVDL